jgi:beta-mannosidase
VLSGGFNCSWPPKNLPPAQVRGNRSWTFQINGRRTFAHGANWLPCNMAVGTCDAAAYERLLGAAAHANINFLRVWGGGGFEKDEFYDAADRLGILVTQEMPNSQMMPHEPPDAAVLHAQAEDIRAAVARLRGRPSLVRWGWGNEIYGVNRSSNPFERQYEEIANAMDPTRRATHGSPVTWVARHGPYCFYFVSGRGTDNASHPFPCTQTPGYAAFNSLEAPVMNQEGANDPIEWDEYGTPGLSSARALRRWMPPAALAYPTGIDSMSDDWVYHRGFRAVANPPSASKGSPYWTDRDAYLPLFGSLNSLEEEVAVSQWAQTEGLRYANQAHRRRMPHRSMSAFWSFNEPFANAAYLSVVEYESAAPKMAYFAAVRGAYAEVDVSLEYDQLVLRAGAPLLASIWLVSERIASLNASLNAAVTTLTGAPLLSHTFPIALSDDTRGPGTALRVGALNFAPPSSLNGQVILVRLQLQDVDGVASGRASPLAEQVYAFAIDSRGAHPMRPMLTAPTAHLKLAIVSAAEPSAEAAGGAIAPAAVVSISNLGANPALYVHLEVRARDGSLARSSHSDDYITLWGRNEEARSVRVELLAPDASTGHGLEICATAWNLASELCTAWPVNGGPVV